jgi:ABC-2 type transport system ATP-binding protein
VRSEEGEVVAVGTVAELRARSSLRVEITFGGTVPPDDFAGLPGVRDVIVEPAPAGTVPTCQVTGPPDALIKAAARHPVQDLRADEPDLEDLFFDYYKDEETGHAA